MRMQEVVKQLDASPSSAGLEQVLDTARALLDSMAPDEIEQSAEILLDWSALQRGQHVASIRERCRLLSYAAIMHGSELLPHTPAILRQLVACLGEAGESVDEELLRTIGNIARYVPPSDAMAVDSLIKMIRPLLVGAGSLSKSSLRRTLCFRAVLLVLTESPRRLLETPTALLPVLHGMLTVLTDQESTNVSISALLRQTPITLRTEALLSSRFHPPLTAPPTLSSHAPRFRPSRPSSCGCAPGYASLARCVAAFSPDKSAPRPQHHGDGYAPGRAAGNRRASKPGEMRI